MLWGILPTLGIPFQKFTSYSSPCRVYETVNEYSWKFCNSEYTLVASHLCEYSWMVCNSEYTRLASHLCEYRRFYYSVDIDVAHLYEWVVWLVSLTRVNQFGSKLDCRSVLKSEILKFPKFFRIKKMEQAQKIAWFIQNKPPGADGLGFQSDRE